MIANRVLVRDAATMKVLRLETPRCRPYAYRYSGGWVLVWGRKLFRDIGEVDPSLI